MSDLKFTYPDEAPPKPGRGDGMGLLLILGFQGAVWFAIGWLVRGLFQ